MATHLYILAALVALFSTTKSLPEEDNKLNELLSKTKLDGEKSFVFLSNDVNKDSESIKLSQKGSSFLQAVPFVENEKTDFKQIGNEQNKINLKDENWNLMKWLQNVMDLVRKLDIENLVGISNDKELPNNTNTGVSVDKAKKSNEKSEKAKFLEIYPIVYVPEFKKEQTAEKAKFRPLFGNSLSPTLKKQSSKNGYDLEPSFDKDSLESYEEGDPCDYESDEINDDVIKATTSSRNIKHMTTKTTNPEIKRTSANEKSTKLLTNTKIVEQHKISHTTPTLIYIKNSKMEPLHEATINKAISENFPDSEYVTQNSSVTNIIPKDNDVVKSSMQNNDSQVTTSYFEPKSTFSDNLPQNMNPINLSTNDKMPFPISNFSNQEIIVPSVSDTNKTTLSIDYIQVPSNTKPMDIGRKNDQALFRPLTEPVENINSSSENPAHYIERIKINNVQHDSPDTTHSFIPVQIPSNQPGTKQIQKDNKLPSKTAKNMLVQAPKVNDAKSESQISDQKSIHPTTKSSNIIQNISHEKPVAQKPTESHNILQTNKDIPLTESLVSSEVLDKNPNIDQNILQSVTPTLISFQNMPSEVPTEQSLNDKQNILSSVPDNKYVPEEIALEKIPKNSLENNKVILSNQKIINDPIINDEIIFQTIDSPSFSQNSVFSPSPDIQNSPFAEILNTIPNDDLNGFKHSIPSFDITQRLPNEDKLIPDDNQNKYPYSTSSLLDIQNSPIEEVSNTNPIDHQLQNPITDFNSNQKLPLEDSTSEISSLNLKKLHYPSTTPGDILNPSIGRMFNKISSNEQNNLQNPIPSLDSIQNSPAEEAFDKTPSGDKITSQYFETSSDNIKNSPVEEILNKSPNNEENKLEYPVPSLNSLQNSPIESILNKIPNDDLNKSQYLISSPNNNNLPVEGVINDIPSDEKNKLQYPVSSLGSIRNSPMEEILNKIPNDDLNKSQYLISSPNNIQNLPVKGVLNSIPGDEQNKLQFSAPSLGVIQDTPNEGVLNQIPSEDLNKSQYLMSLPNSIQNLPVEGVLNKIPNEEQDKLQYSSPSLGSIQNSPHEEKLNNMPSSDLNKSQYLISSPNNIQNLPVEEVLNNLPNDEQNKLKYSSPSLGAIQNSPIDEVLNQIPSEDLNKSQYLMSPPNNIQNLPVEGILNKIPNDEQEKLQYSVPSLGSIQNSSNEEKLNNMPSNDLNKSQYLISSPNNIQNLPVEEVLNKTPSEDLTKVQNLIPSLDEIQISPIEDEINKVPSDEINKLKPSLDNSQNLNASISEDTPENNIKKKVHAKVVPTSQQNPAFQSNVGQISSKQDSTPILKFDQYIPVQYDQYENGQETDLKPKNKGSDHELSPLNNKDKILEDNKYVLHFTTPYPIVVQNSSNQISTEQPETDSKNISLPTSDISSDNTKSIIISNLPKNSKPLQSSSSEQLVQNFPNENSLSTLNKKAPQILPLSLPETTDDKNLNEENIPEKLPLIETPFEKQSINFSETDSSNDLTENEDNEYIEEEIEDDSSEDDEDSYSSEDDYDDTKEELINSFPKNEYISSKNAPVQYSSSTAPTKIKKQVEVNEEEKSYDTFLQFLYRHSNSPFIQSLRENSTLS